MGYAAGDSNNLPAANVAGGLRSQRGPAGGGDGYEYGSITGLSRTVRYKAFQTAFSARPVVILGGQGLAGGTIVPRILGTPNVGSFRASVLTIPAAGSYNMYYVAFGPR